MLDQIRYKENMIEKERKRKIREEAE